MAVGLVALGFMRRSVADGVEARAIVTMRASTMETLVAVAMSGAAARENLSALSLDLKEPALP
jgi:hypothetical protein